MSRTDAVQPWRDSVALLRSTLPELAKRAHVDIILSNHFVRYVLLPWSRELRSERDWLAFAYHTFGKIHGPAAADWDMRVSGERTGAARIASAIDRELLSELMKSCAASGSKLNSVRPFFMSAFNRSRRALRKDAAWFAVSEPGRLALGLMKQGIWQQIRTRKTNESCSLFDCVDREASLGAVDFCERIVFIGNPAPPEERQGRYRVYDCTLSVSNGARDFSMVLT